MFDSLFPLIHLFIIHSLFENIESFVHFSFDRKISPGTTSAAGINRHKTAEEETAALPAASSATNPAVNNKQKKTKNQSNNKGSVNGSSKQQQQRNRDDLRLTRMMLIIFCCFLLCFLPLMVVNVADDEVLIPSLFIHSFLG